ncbi:MAG: hypothetical protein QXI94_04920 [Sulfolobales archaeon]
MSLGALLYGVPVYRESGSTYSVKVPLVRIHLHNDVVANAYKYVVYRFSQYAYLRMGVIIRNYTPPAGTIDVEVPAEALPSGRSAEKLVLSLYREFVEQYLAPRLIERIRTASLDDLLAVFYRRRNEGGPQTGLTSVILPLKYMKNYIEDIKLNKWAIQKQSIEALKKIEGKISKEVQRLKDKGVKKDDLVIVGKNGDVVPLETARIQEELGKTSLFSDDVKYVSRNTKRCCYCGSEIKEPGFPATGKLGVGRYRLPQVEKTNLSGEALVCLRCVLLSMYYVLEGGENTLLYTFNGLLGVFIAEGRLPSGTTVDFAVALAKQLARKPAELTASMVMNSAFGEERAKLQVENLNEVAVERLALLAHVFPLALHDEAVQRELINYMFSEPPAFISHLVYVLLKQLEKGGGMSYVSKEIPRYITPYLYREKELRVAYTLAAIAEGVIHRLKQDGADNYTLKEVANNLTTGGLTTALSYAIQRMETPPSAIALSKFIDRTLAKEVLGEYGFRYDEGEDGTILVYLNTIPSAEVKIREELGQRVFNRAYDVLLVLSPEIATRKKGESEESKGESVAQG